MITTEEICTYVAKMFGKMLLFRQVGEILNDRRFEKIALSAQAVKFSALF
jgi:hypothetical protein